MSCDRMTRLASSPPTRTAADVSWQGVSMPRTASATPLRCGCAAAYRDRVGNGARRDAARRDHGDAGDTLAGVGARDVRDDAQRIAGEGLHPLLRTTHGHRHLGR